MATEDRGNLVISRREGEKLFIEGNIEIEVVEITRNRVRIAIRAPRSVSILRGEVRETMDDE